MQHLNHALSYPISGLNYAKSRYQHPGYVVDHPIVPVRSLLSLDLHSHLAAWNRGRSVRTGCVPVYGAHLA